MAYLIARGLIDDPAWLKWFKSLGVDTDKMAVTGLHIHFVHDDAVRISFDTFGITEQLADNPPPPVKDVGPVPHIDMADFLRIWEEAASQPKGEPLQDARTKLLRVLTGETDEKGPPLGSPEHSAAVSRACRKFLEWEMKQKKVR